MLKVPICIADVNDVRVAHTKYLFRCCGWTNKRDVAHRRNPLKGRDESSGKTHVSKIIQSTTVQNRNEYYGNTVTQLKRIKIRTYREEQNHHVSGTWHLSPTRLMLFRLCDCTCTPRTSTGSQCSHAVVRSSFILVCRYRKLEYSLKCVHRKDDLDASIKGWMAISLLKVPKV